MGKTRKVNKRFSFANNLILENDLELLSGRLYTDINGIVFILGLGLFISLVNCIFLLTPNLNRNPNLTDSKDSFILINYLSIESPNLPLTTLNSIFEYISYPVRRKSFLKSVARIRTPPKPYTSQIFLLVIPTEANRVNQILFLECR